ncbi:MAG: patatin-like phospholipase family protein, partial [Clostridiales bacterium]|nr:patatin-like phospholipase family protein [Clostridiales bacterium]
MNTTNYMEETCNDGLGLVFSGGGSKGSYEIGAWKALDELGLAGRIAGVSGSSIGAFNTALFAQGDLGAAEYIWRDMRATDMVNINFGKIAEKFIESEGASPKEAFLQNVRLVETGANAKAVAEDTLSRLFDAAAGKLAGAANTAGKLSGGADAADGQLVSGTDAAASGGKNKLSNYAIWAAQNLFGDGFATPEKLIGILRNYVNFELIQTS